MAEPKIEVLSRESVQFAGHQEKHQPFFRLEHWQVARDGVVDDRIIWRRGDFVIVVAMTVEGELVVIREYKQAAEEVLLGFPAGGIKKGETAIEAALRELYEETGYCPTEGVGPTLFDGPLFNSPDKSTERHFIVFFPSVERQGSASPEESETILGTVLLKPGEALSQLRIALHLGALARAIL